VLRKCHGFGAMAMIGALIMIGALTKLGGIAYDNFVTVFSTMGAFGAMGLEGSVQLGYCRKLDAVEDPEENRTPCERLVAEMYELYTAIKVARHWKTTRLSTRLRPVYRCWLVSGPHRCVRRIQATSALC